MSEQPRDWDPKAQERQYVRHARTGDLGWIVRRDGREHVRYDRGELDQTIALKRDDKGALIDWTLEREPAPMTVYQVAFVAYAADSALDKFLGEHGRRKPWMEMNEDERRKWAELGPKDKHRQRLFTAIFDALQPLTE